MKERPILFSAPMVRALLDGRKTQTRRVCKGQALQLLMGEFAPSFVADIENGLCPYGHPGDRLWVRETWRIYGWSEEYPNLAIEHIAGPKQKSMWVTPPKNPNGKSFFVKYLEQSIDDCAKAGLKPDADGIYKWPPGESPCRLRPSIHMPRWASRITLEITGVRVKRLQDISDADAVAEGVGKDSDGWFDYWEPSTQYCTSASESYQTLWESINGPGSWDANPWVWVVEFKRLQGGETCALKKYSFTCY